tara:strand:- start:16011 stop:16307 length:297 start_codon:yes stop_codon:yes gene_type:complete
MTNKFPPIGCISARIRSKNPILEELEKLKAEAESLQAKGHNTAQKIMNMSNNDIHEAFAVCTDLADARTEDPLENVRTFYFRDGSKLIFTEHTMLEGD